METQLKICERQWLYTDESLITAQFPRTPLCIDGTKTRVLVWQRNTNGCYRLSEITGLFTNQHIAI